MNTLVTWEWMLQDSATHYRLKYISSPEQSPQGSDTPASTAAGPSGLEQRRESARPGGLSENAATGSGTSRS